MGTSMVPFDMVEHELARQALGRPCWKKVAIPRQLPEPDPITGFFLGLLYRYDRVAAFGEVRIKAIKVLADIEVVESLDRPGIALCQRDLCAMDPDQLSDFLIKARGWDIAIAEPVRRYPKRSYCRSVWYHPYPDIFREQGFTAPDWEMATKLVRGQYVGLHAS